MSYNLPRKQPVTSTKNSQKSTPSSPKPSRQSFPNFDFDEDEDEELGVNHLLDIDFTDLELDTQKEFTYQEEEDTFFDDEEDQDFGDEEE